MLKQNHDKSLKQQKLHEAVLKHKVRNLRAKVQSILPVHLCQKIEKRSNRLKKQLLKKRILEQELNFHGDSHQQLKKDWKYTSGNVKRVNQNDWSQNLVEIKYLNSSKNLNYKNSCQCNLDSEIFIGDGYNDSKGKLDRKKYRRQADLKGYHFQKLADQQIEWIQEDKLYYLIEEVHINAFQKFIKQKYKPKTTSPITNQVYTSVSKSTITIGTNNSIQPSKNQQSGASLKSKRTLNYSSGNWIRSNSLTGGQQNLRSKNQFNSLKRSSSGQMRFFRNTANSKFSLCVNDNLARINEEENLKRVLLSMQLKSKQQKVEENYYKIRISKLQLIEKENIKEKQKIQSAQEKKRKIYHEAGQIVDLAEKLRKKCIRRKTYREKDHDKSSFYQSFQQGFS